MRLVSGSVKFFDHISRKQEGAMKQSQHFLENAENCARLAEGARGEPTHKRYKRMEAAWRALAEEQDWLDGEVPALTDGDVQEMPRGNNRLRSD